jgi:NAD(P)H-flavin reductase
MNVYAKCSNYATDTCPCVLAESGHCIVCSMCRGEDFCDCQNTVSFCIMQELKNNGGKAKDQHHIMKCTVLYEKIYDDTVKLLRLSVPDGRAKEFQRIGAFVFVRAKENTFYDVPISVLYKDFDTDSVELMIKLQGVKTECFRDLNKGDTVFLRGPYLNGIQGLRALVSVHDKDALVICRGIGLFPSLHAISELKKNNNRIKIYLDSGDMNKSLLHAAKDLFELEIEELSIYDDKGEISPLVYKIIDDAVKNDTGIIHLGMSNYLIKRLVDYVEKTDGDMQLSCINNSHMCCGEGICGACTVNTDSRQIVHLCKEQMDMYEYGKLLV